MYESSIHSYGLNLFTLCFRLKLLFKFILNPDWVFIGIVIIVVHDNQGNQVIIGTKVMSQNICTHNTHILYK
jgi:hypothetical protein